MKKLITLKKNYWDEMISSWKLMEKCKLEKDKTEAIIRLELKASGEKFTIPETDAKIKTDSTYDKAAALEIDAEAIYKLAQGTYNCLADEFEALKSLSFMIGRVSL